MSFLVNLFDKCLYKWEFSKLNIIKTLIFNFRTMPFHLAIKFPVFLYGKVNLYMLKGKVEFKDCQVKSGMVKMGMNKEYLGIGYGASLFLLREDSRLIFEGESEFSNNFLVRTGKSATLKIGKDTFFGSTVKLVCINKVSIGEGTRIAFESQVIDSDFHYVYNLDRNQVKPREKEIRIGAFNWIGNRTTISKGAITKQYTIVANSSVVNKNFEMSEDNNVVLGGQPAIQIAKNIRRIYPLNIEERLVDFFHSGQGEISEELRLQIEQSFI